MPDLTTQGASSAASQPDAMPEQGWSRVEAVPPTSPSSDTSASPSGQPWVVVPQAGAPAPSHSHHRRRRGAVAGLAAACMVFSMAAGFGGGYLASRITADSAEISTASDKPVLYQSVADTGNTGELSVADVAESAADTVVEITAQSVSNSFYGQQVSESAGSGVILSTDGYIVTNNHVVEGASQITVRTRDGQTYTAQLIGRDSETDLAVLKIEATGLTAAVLGDSDQLVVGETAIAIGNPLGELGGTVTSGIISALSREITTSDGVTMHLLQTSAAINPGNSGGGLFNSDGELIGIVNAKSVGTGVEGLGFAIPINTAKPVIEDLISKGYVSGRVDTGFTTIDLTSQEEALQWGVRQTGIYVYQVTSSSSPLQPGDCILSIDGQEIESLSDYNNAIQAHSVGDTLSITVLRSGRQVTVSLTLQEAGQTGSNSL